jgi:hypothetical protein
MGFETEFLDVISKMLVVVVSSPEKARDNPSHRVSRGAAAGRPLAAWRVMLSAGRASPRQIVACLRR